MVRVNSAVLLQNPWVVLERAKLILDDVLDHHLLVHFMTALISGSGVQGQDFYFSPDLAAASRSYLAADCIL